MSSETGAADNKVALFYHPAYLEHDTGYHPESPQRLRAILRALEKYGVPETELLRPQPGDLDVLSEVHDPRYVAAVEKIALRGGGYWDLDTYISPGSYNAALLAVGAATSAVDSAMQGGRSAFALVRPPGHHALPGSAMGFCVFNNVAVAAHYATRKYGLDSVLIVDWDVHHGNGTQDIFYERPDVLFFSTHQYPFYPGTGALNDTGEGAGAGYTVNVPLPARVDDAGYVRVFHEVLVPLAQNYRPQLILISAGYDAHLADPIGGMAVSVAGFHQMAQIVRQLAGEIKECDGRVAAVLEGGYNVEALASSVVATIAALQSPHVAARMEPNGRHSQEAPRLKGAPDVSNIIEQVQRVHNLKGGQRTF